MHPDENESMETKPVKESKKVIVKKDYKLNIGSDLQSKGKDVIIEMKKGDELSSQILSKYKSSLETEGVI